MALVAEVGGSEDREVGERKVMEVEREVGVEAEA